MREYGPYTIRCAVFGCDWGRWIGDDADYIDTAGRKCHRCGRWEYRDGSTLPPSGGNNSVSI